MVGSLLETAVVAVQSIGAQSADRLASTLREHGLTHATAQALWAIDPVEPPPSMKTIAERLFCNAPNLSFVVNQLTSRGLVERTVDPDDKRSRLITLTPQGLEARQAVIDAAIESTPLARLSPDALRHLIAVLGEALH